jgi:hypothetical protein
MSAFGVKRTSFVNNLRKINAEHPAAANELVSDNVKEMSSPTRDERGGRPHEMSAYDPNRTLVSSTLAQEDISGGIRDAGKVASMVARALQDPAMGVEPLHSGDICKRPAAAVVHDIEL